MSGLQPPSTKPIEAFDEIIKAQGQFWCPICNLWLDANLCQTVIEHPQLGPDNQTLAHVLFGLCEKCLDSLRGHDAVDAVRIAMAERSAKGVAEVPDKRVKFFVMRKKQS